MLTASEFDRILTPDAQDRGQCEGAGAPLGNGCSADQRIRRAAIYQRCDAARARGRDQARDLYSKHYAPVEQCGFVTNNKWGFTLGCSPDGLVGDDGMIEVKSRCQRFQVETICANAMPDDFCCRFKASCS
jgi:hypothetical protein